MINKRDSIRARNITIEISAGVTYDSHKAKRGLSWKKASRIYLVNRLIEELSEFLNALTYEEAGDVLNFMSMIIAHRAEGLSLDP